MKKILFLIASVVIFSACGQKTTASQKEKHPHHKGGKHGNKKRRGGIKYDNNGELPKETIRLKNISYKKIGDKSLALDLYKPNATAKNLPLVIWIHGGAWKRGDKEAFLIKNNRLVNSLLNNGYAIASVNYRLSGEASFPAPIQDCNDAINFLTENAEKYGLDKQQFIAMGRSAGGHLASLVASSNSHKISDFFSNQQMPKFKIKALVCFFPPTDLLTLKDDNGRNSANSPEGKLLGGSVNDLQELAKKASSITYIDANTPPTILLHGKNDQNVPYQQSVDFKTKLDNFGIKNEIYLVENARHSDPIFDTETYVNYVIEFLKNVR